MDDDIKLPPLPPVFEWASMAHTAKTIKDYGHAAVLADRERRAKKAQPAKPQVHEARLSLADNGDWSVGGDDRRPGRLNILIRWTDGRAWIDSEQNWEQAAMLRKWGYHGAADALDGGVR